MVLYIRALQNQGRAVPDAPIPRAEARSHLAESSVASLARSTFRKGSRLNVVHMFIESVSALINCTLSKY